MTQTLEHPGFSLTVEGKECFATELYSARQIQEGIEEMGAQLAGEYQDAPYVVMVPILQGAINYAVALRNAMKRAGAPPIVMEGMRASSMDKTRSTGTVKIIKDLIRNPAGEDLLFVDDIFDTGLTLRGIVRHVGGSNPKSMRVTTLLDKPSNLRIPGAVEEIGGVATVFTMEEPSFVIGFGLDYEEEYRGLDYIARVRMPLPGGGFEE